MPTKSFTDEFVPTDYIEARLEKKEVPLKTSTLSLLAPYGRHPLPVFHMTMQKYPDNNFR
jgi:hypothetical protein